MEDLHNNFISVVVPARNEEKNIARAVNSLAAQPEIAEIIVVNDSSSDDTAAILSELAARNPQLRILESGDLPPGWTGKNRAAWLGAQAVTHEWLLFTDADVEHFPGSAKLAQADAAEHGAALVSYSPEQVMHSFAERALIPFIFCRLAKMYRYDRVNDSACSDAAANGQFLLVRRGAYFDAGGHCAVRGEVLEDVALARRVKRAGNRIFFAPGARIARTRMYDSFRDMWQGWTKNLYSLIGGSHRATVWELLRVFPAVEFVLIGMGVAIRNWMLASLGVALLTVRVLRYEAALRRNLFRLAPIQFYLVGVIVYVAALCASAWKNTRGAVQWKGREYPAGMA
ncbi:MAG: glycosyltransferase [Candidatus Acidiferrales bacterium]